jgi:hypothetical protein
MTTMDSGTHSNCCVANNAGRRAEDLVNILHTFTGCNGNGLCALPKRVINMLSSSKRIDLGSESLENS